MVRETCKKVNDSMSNFVKEMKEIDAPCFVAVLIPGKGYKYQMLMPEEIENEKPEIVECYGKFNKFLQVCLDFNKEDYGIDI